MARTLFIDCYPEKQKYKGKVESYLVLLRKFSDDVVVAGCHNLAQSDTLGRARVSPFDAVVISGSLMMLEKEDPPARLVEFVRRLRCPVLGICFGHQLLGRAFGAEVRSSAQFLEQLEKVRILVPGNIFHGLGSEIEVLESHREYLEPDSVKSRGWQILAVSDSCPVEAMRHKELPFYGVQFHPERSNQIGEKIVANFYNRVVRAQGN